MSTENNATLDWHEAVEIAERTHSTASRVQEDAEHSAAVPTLLPKRFAAVETTKHQLTELQRTIAEEEERCIEVARGWNGLLDQREKLRHEITFARDQLAALEARLVEKTHWIEGSLWGNPHHGEPPVRVVPHFAGILALERAIANGRAWIPKAISRADTLELRLAEFAKQHAIKTK